MSGVQFFFSCVTSVMCNAKSAKDDDNETSDTHESYPAIAYFVVYKECATCNEKILFSTIHNEELDAEVTRIRVRTSSDSNNEMEKAAKRLFQVVKDHNNNTIQEMLHISNVYCYKNSEGTPSDDDEEDDEPEFASIHFPKFHFFNSFSLLYNRRKRKRVSGSYGYGSYKAGIRRTCC